MSEKRYFVEHGAWHDRKTGRHLHDIVEGEIADPISRLLGALAGDDLTPEEARAELEECGVDVDAFLRRVREELTPTCNGCGAEILPENYRVADGCPCNSRRGINHGGVPKATCTCVECDPEQTGATRYPTITQKVEEPK